jgi:hypothetical protein
MQKTSRFCAVSFPVILLAIGAYATFQASNTASTVRVSQGEGLPALQSLAPDHLGIVFTQLPVSPPSSGRALSAERARLVRLMPNGSLRVLTRDFHSAADPEVSFDGKRILFAGKRQDSEHWQIYEMQSDGSGVRQITQEPADCRSPVYQSTLYVITSDKPWYQITFVGHRGGAASLYSCKLDGTAVRRLTYNPYDDVDPFLLPDGRLLFAGRQKNRLEPGPRDRMPLFGVNLDGTDYAVFSGEEGAPVKRMPCVTTDGLAVFVEPREDAWDGAGALAAVTVRRNLHSYRRLPGISGGLYHSPSPLPRGEILVSRRPADGSGTHGIYRFNPAIGEETLIYDDPGWHDIQPKILLPRAEPDGRSSVVDESDPTGKLYCLNVYTTDFRDRMWLAPGTVKRLRVLEGLPPSGGSVPTMNGPTPDLETRFLGEIGVEDDGSFNIQIPANIPIRLQLLDENGMALRSCAWIWVKNKEPRGCIGCHEDGELTPENRFVKALAESSIPLTLPPERRRTVDFDRDIKPILTARCDTASCHGKGETRLDLRKYVRPGAARTSPLVWSLFGRDTSRPWDRLAAGQEILHMPAPGSPALTEDEKRTIIEWIDLGAHRNGGNQ